MKAEHIKNGALALLAAAGGLLAQALGGWDTALQSLIFCMAVDYLTGMLVAGVFRRSGKTESGALDSRAGFRGLCKKAGELAAVLVACWLLSAARKRIGGVTGDVFGALIETTECAVLAVCCLP